MTVHYVRHGHGEPLVLIHGIGHHWRAWEPVIARLAEHHDVIALDLPGFGRTPAPASNLGMPTAVASLQAFFSELGLDRPHVAGNSLGGAIALELAAAGRARSVTALSPAGFATPAEAQRALRILRSLRFGAFTPAPVLRVFYRTAFGRRFSFGTLVTDPSVLTPERALADTLALRGGRGFTAVARHGSTYAFTGAPAVPVTIAWGEHDRILLPVQAERARAALATAGHVVLRGCGHVPMSDDPDAVARVILATTARTG
ncbi:alpha/beta fold hydrolase [Dactylosporangium vinaceum]|uniref:Alpha/beta fold hydrolase n=1 Tax=Dactylosporangium vinaceum TaxID=53362 RepID=A0ABV5MHH3_9ACTN|nr:alpha/beta fold hydrolase [Dactylosporangium vinaceum]UAB94760.1 alpha/beta fold hydrolase [Dactylosporangium vinaceum]